MAGAARISLTLSLYTARRFLGGFALVLGSIGAIIFLVDVVELLRRSSTNEAVTFAVVLQLALLKLPHALEKVVAFAVLFGAMYTFWRLTRTSELVVARASGISIWQFLTPVILTAAFLGMFFIMVINPLGAAMLLSYEQTESQLFKGRSALLAVSDSGLWLRQADQNGQSVIHARRSTPGATVLQDVTVYLYDPAHRFTGRLDADSARLEDGQWRLQDVLVTAPNKPSAKEPVYTLPTDWTAEKIKDSFSSPDTLSFWNLPGFIALLDHAGFAATRHRVHWNSLLALPLMLAAMVLIAASFSMRMARRGGVPLLIGSGVLFSFFVFFLSDVVFALGFSATIPAVLAAWSPALVTLLIGLSILLHIEES